MKKKNAEERSPEFRSKLWDVVFQSCGTKGGRKGVIEGLAGRIFYFPLPLFCRRLPTPVCAKSVITGKKTGEGLRGEWRAGPMKLRKTRLFVILWLSSSTHLVSASHTNLSASNSDHTDSLISRVQERVPIKRQLLPHCALKSFRNTAPAFEMEPKEKKKRDERKHASQVVWAH